MPKPPPSPGHADDAEQAFQEALQQGDVERLMACWADEDDIVCVHPGSQRLLGQAAVRQSFAALLASGGLRVTPQQQSRLEAAGCCVYSCLERVEAHGHDGPALVWVQATRVYIKTLRGWRLAAHHASLAPEGAADVKQGVASGLLH